MIYIAQLDNAMTDSQGRLSLAAVSISTILSENGIEHGIFWGWAVNMLGGHRATTDIDCLAAIGKDELLELMVNQQDWTKIPNMREDYTAFSQDDPVEIFVGELLSMIMARIARLIILRAHETIQQARKMQCER